MNTKTTITDAIVINVSFMKPLCVLQAE